jgi:uncharacterized protein with FMN-binding domain
MGNTRAMRGGQPANKVGAAAVIVGAFILYGVMHARASTTALASQGPGGSGTSPGGATGASAGATGTSSGHYKNGTYVGKVADAQWGYVQVKAVIQNGNITDVQFLQYPSDRNRSIEINSYADPQLTNEAIQAQSAQVDIVSGATDSSEAFMQSLADALSQAQA